MDLKLFVSVFITIFIAEIADKTQIATLLYASNAQHSKLTVFLGAFIALAITSAIAVIAGSALANWIDQKLMAKLAGIIFILIGIWTFMKS